MSASSYIRDRVEAVATDRVFWAFAAGMWWVQIVDGFQLGTATGFVVMFVMLCLLRVGRREGS